MVDFLEGEGKRRAVILLVHLPSYGFLKHLVLFSVDTVEKDGFAIEKDKNRSRASIAQRLIPSIETV